MQQEIMTKILLKRRLAVTAIMMLKYKKRKKKCWVHPIKELRLEQEDGENLINELRLSDEEQFFNYTRLNVKQFDFLLSMVKNKLTKVNTFRKSISPETRLVLTLRHLAAGDALPSLANAFRVGKSTACTIIKETCDVLWDTLSPIYIQFPTQNEWLEIANDFEDHWDLPHCLGAIDGKHIDIQPPHNSGSQHSNSEESFSILFAVCDANYRFTYVDIGTYGAQGSGGVLKESVFGNKLFNGELNLPDDDNISNTDIKCPYFFVGDDAFPLYRHLLRPYGGRHVGKEQRIYNFRLTRARQCIENAFGVLISRFMLFHKVINAHSKTVDSIVKATICLHNFIRCEENSGRSTGKYCPDTYVDRYDTDGNVIPGDWRSNIPKNPALNSARNLRRRLGTRNATREAEGNREIIKNYLNSPSGAIPWQQSIN